MAGPTFVVGSRKTGGFVLQARGKKQKIDAENYPRVMKEAPRKWAFPGREGAKNRVYFLARLA
jgi:hypothetical protein